MRRCSVGHVTPSSCSNKISTPTSASSSARIGQLHTYVAGRAQWLRIWLFLEFFFMKQCWACVSLRFEGDVPWQDTASWSVLPEKGNSINGRNQIVVSEAAWGILPTNLRYESDVHHAWTNRFDCVPLLHSSAGPWTRVPYLDTLRLIGNKNSKKNKIMLQYSIIPNLAMENNHAEDRFTQRNKIDRYGVCFGYSHNCEIGIRIWDISPVMTNIMLDSSPYSLSLARSSQQGAAKKGLFSHYSRMGDKYYLPKVVLAKSQLSEFH